MAMTSSHCDRIELMKMEEEVKPRASTAQRNLFGPVDHQQLHQDFERMMYMSLEVAKQRWNFDFQNECPLPGSVEWEEMRCQDMPTFYHSCVIRAGKRKLEFPVSTEADYREAKFEKRAVVPLGVKYRQASITDFYTAKKRRHLQHKVSSRE